MGELSIVCVDEHGHETIQLAIQLVDLFHDLSHCSLKHQGQMSLAVEIFVLLLLTRGNFCKKNSRKKTKFRYYQPVTLTNYILTIELVATIASLDSLLERGAINVTDLTLLLTYLKCLRR